jgi:uncharacterized OB-fold protein
MPNRPVPEATPETREYWEGTSRGELRIQRCRSCGDAYFYPRPFCPSCSSRDVEWFTASGRATLHTYVIVHRGAHGFQDWTPYVIAIVQLDEGPRMMSNVIGVEPAAENLPVGLPLEVTFEPLSDTITIPLFKPAGAAT